MPARRPLPGFSREAEVSLADQLSALEKRLAALESVPRAPQVQTGDFLAKDGQFVIVEAPASGLTALLPQARPQNRGQRITFSFKNANPVRFLCVDGLVNNQAAVISTRPGTFDAVSDGQSGWYVDQGATATGSTTDAEFLVGAADASLPNARLATDSTEIDADLTSSGVVSWALRASSVVFSKLANLTGLSVLGRAANSTGVMAAITATAERQALMSDSAGTSLGWRAPEIADLADVDADSFLGNVTASSGAVTANSLATLAGNFLTYAGSGVINWDGVLVSQGPTSIGTFTSLDFLDGTNTTAGVADVGGGVVAITFNVDLSSVTYTAGDGLNLSSNEFSVDASAIAGGGLVGFGSILSVVGGDGIDVAADSVAVDVSDFAGAGLENDGSNNLRIAAAAAGAGLTGGGGSSLAVGAGSGITVNANDVQISNNGVSNAMLRDSNAQSVIGRASNSSGDPADIITSGARQALMSNSSGTAIGWRSIEAADLPNPLVTDGDKGDIVVSGSGTIWRLDSAVAGAGLTGGGGSALSVQVDNSRHIEINDDFGDYIGFKKSQSRVIIYDDFFLTSSGSSAVDTFINTFENQWILSPSGTASWTASGSQGRPGLGQFTTGSSTNNSLTLYLGGADNFHFRDLEEVSACFSVSTTSSIYFEFGWVSSSSGFCIISYLSGTCTVYTNDGVSTTTSPAISSPSALQHEYKIAYTGSSVKFYQGSTLLATHTTHIPNSLGRFYFALQTKANATKSIFIDHFSLSSINLARGT